MSDYNENNWDKPVESRREQRRREANERQAIRDSRSDEAQLARLDKLGFRAEKERARLKARI